MPASKKHHDPVHQRQLAARVLSHSRYLRNLITKEGISRIAVSHTSDGWLRVTDRATGRELTTILFCSP